MLQQQLALDREAKMKEIRNEAKARVQLINGINKHLNKDMKMQLINGLINTYFKIVSSP